MQTATEHRKSSVRSAPTSRTTSARGLSCRRSGIRTTYLPSFHNFVTSLTDEGIFDLLYVLLFREYHLKEPFLSFYHSHADGKQRKLLEENYGKHDKLKVEKVKKLFVDLKLEEIFKEYEEESYKAIQVRNVLHKSQVFVV